jgi:hypothetical protein
MAEQEIKTIYLFRSGVIISDIDNGGSVMGERGYLVVGNNVLYTIERTKIGGANSTRLPDKGTFECTMVKTQKLPKGFWITQTGEFGHNKKNSAGAYSALKIHSANKLSEISGCVAPGRITTEKGVAQSNDAMQDIFTYCGGWGEGKKMMLEVDSL